MPKISVIVPTLQEEKYVADTLSKLVKNNPQIEIIVVDGGSEDGTIKIARRYTDKVYKSDKRGISITKNYGAKKSKGDLLIFLDADVIAMDGFVEKVTDTFKDQKIVGATCNIMPIKPRPLEYIFFYFQNLLIRSLTWLPNSKLTHSRGEFFVARKNKFQEVGGFDESMACLEDHELANRLSKVGKFAFIKNLTVYESMRRIRKSGLVNVVSLWIKNYIFYILRGEPFSKVWKPVR